MKTKALVSMLLVLAVVFAGCAGPDLKKDAEADDKTKLAGEYMARARQQESQGDLVEALESYKLALTVDPADATAQAKQAEVEKKLNLLAAESYKQGANCSAWANTPKPGKSF